MNAFIGHVLYDFKTGLRDKGKLLMYYLFPLVFFALVGGLMSAINPNFGKTMIPAMVLFAYMSSALLSLPGSLVQAREAGILRSFRINGVPAASVLGAPMISLAAHMAVVTLVITAAGIRIFGGVSPVNTGGFILTALASYVLYASLGMLIGVVAGGGSSAIMISQVIFIPSIILGGLMIPSSTLPSIFSRIALLFPASHCMNLFGVFALGTGGRETASLFVVCASIVVNIGLASWLFRWDSGTPGRKGFFALLAAVPYAAAFIAAGVAL